MPPRNSVLIERISEDKILAIIRASLGEHAEIASCKSIDSVMFNTVYEIRTEQPKHHFMLRIAPADQQTIRSYERSMMLNEPVIYEIIRNAGIPTARILTVDGSRTIIDRDYIIMDYIEGVPLDDESVPEDVRPGIMRQIGAYTARMHEIRGDKFGWIMPDGSIRGSESWAEVFGELLTEMCERNIEVETITPDDADVILGYYRDHRNVFDECKTPVFVHNDVWAPNIIVKQTGGAWQIEGIIDAERALFADSEFEYAIRDESATDLMLGYGKSLDPSPNAALRRKFYQLELYMLYSWFHLDMSPNPNFQAHSLKIVKNILQELRES